MSGLLRCALRFERQREHGDKAVDAAQRGGVSDISAVAFHAALAEGEKPCDFFAAFNPVLVVGERVERRVPDDLEVGERLDRVARLGGVLVIRGG